jgi:hypothetical protein
MKKKASITPRMLFSLAVLFYVILFFLYYPPFYTTLDEMGYIKGADYLKGGEIGTGDPLSRYGFIFTGQKYVPIIYGMPIFLLPFIVFGWKAAFISGLTVHLLSALIFYKLLIRFGWNPDNVLLYLFFPYFIYYSTTLYPDFHSALFILAGFYLYISNKEKHQVLSGAAFGAACIIKITNILAFIPFILLPLIKDRVKFGRILLGAMPVALFILALNYAYYGGIFKLGYFFTEGQFSLESRFSLSFYERYIPGMVFRLLAIYPFMLLAPLFYREKGRAEIILAVAIFFAFFGTRIQSGEGFYLDPSTLTRYFLPIIPLFLLTYIPLYENIVKKLNLPRGLILYGTVLMLMLGGTFILNVQKERLEIQAAVSEDIYKNTDPGALLIGSEDVVRYIMEPFGDRRFLLNKIQDIPTYFDDRTYIVQKRFETMGAYEEEQIRITDELVEDSNAVLIKKIEYRTPSKFFTSRPFTLEIYKVPYSY